MTPPDPLTPEERLLKAVAGEGGSLVGDSPLTGAGSLRGLLGFSRLSGWIQFLDRLSGGHPVRRINQGLSVLIVLLGVYFAFDSMIAPKQLKQAMEVTTVHVAAPEISSAVSTSAPLEEYLSVVKRRDVFHPAGSVVSASTPTQPPASPTEGLRLVGIAWSDQPEALIDDTQVKQTLFLKKGQKIRGLTVQKIGPESVTLQKDNGELVDLK